MKKELRNLSVRNLPVSDLMIEQIRASVTVDGKPLVSKKCTDAKIREQCSIYLNQVAWEEHDLSRKMSLLLRLVPEELSLTEGAAWLQKEVYAVVNWENCPDLDFWSPFWSMPYEVEVGDSNKNLQRGLGHRGMREVFGSVDGSLNQLNLVANFLHDSKGAIQLHRELLALRRQVVISEYRTLDALEEECSVKKAPAAAKILYLDRTVALEERKKAFSIYGEKESCVYEPDHDGLREIFNLYYEEEIERHQIIDCMYIVDWWMYYLQKDRVTIEYSQNKYHPTMKRKKRNYIPSQAALDRLYQYYLEILFVNEVSSFEFDW